MAKHQCNSMGSIFGTLLHAAWISHVLVLTSTVMMALKETKFLSALRKVYTPVPTTVAALTLALSFRSALQQSMQEMQARGSEQRLSGGA